MRIAVASRDGKTVSGHIGKCAQWIIYQGEPGTDTGSPVIREVERISLPKQFIFHYYRDQTPHPLADCDAVIGKSAGKSFIEKMHSRGIDTAMTAETSPAKAAADYIQDKLAPPKPRPIGEIICRIHDAISSDK